MEPSSLEKLERVLDHKFKQRPILVQALTHRSLAHESGSETSISDNEQLEFLGDAVIGLLVAESLYTSYPDLDEGALTRLRAALVSRKHLGQVGTRLKLGSYMLLGKGEERSGGRTKKALLANCMEAVIAALYLDAGIEKTRRFVEKEVIAPSILPLREQLEHSSSIGDYKSALQELLQAQKQGQPQYTVKAESGPDHRKRFLVEVRLPQNGTKPLARGVGGTKKVAEQQAARRAIQKLRAVKTEEAQ